MSNFSISDFIEEETLRRKYSKSALPSGGSIRHKGMARPLPILGSKGKPALMPDSSTKSVFQRSRRSTGSRDDSVLDDLGGGKSHAAGALRKVTESLGNASPGSLAPIALPENPAVPLIKSSAGLETPFMSGLGSFLRSVRKAVPKKVRYGLPLLGAAGVGGLGVLKLRRLIAGSINDQIRAASPHVDQQQLSDVYRYGSE